jgi:hypothetical protein
MWQLQRARRKSITIDYCGLPWITAGVGEYRGAAVDKARELQRRGTALHLSATTRVERDADCLRLQALQQLNELVYIQPSYYVVISIGDNTQTRHLPGWRAHCGI